MKKKIGSLILLFSLSLIDFGQEIIFRLHDSVGDTIDFYEKERYVIFPDIQMNSSEYLLIKKNNDQYRIEIHQENQEINHIEITEQLINDSKNNINCLNDFFSRENAPDTIHFNETFKPKLDSITPNLNLESEAIKKQTKIDQRINFQRKVAQEREQNIKKGHLY
jgi:hypothetical protein